jgi:hypothetical protein
MCKGGSQPPGTRHQRLIGSSYPKAARLASELGLSQLRIEPLTEPNSQRLECLNAQCWHGPMRPQCLLATCKDCN